jgi:hypothetical protein
MVGEDDRLNAVRLREPVRRALRVEQDATASGIAHLVLR